MTHVLFLLTNKRTQYINTMKNLMTTFLAIVLFSFISFASEEGKSTSIDQLFGNSHFSFEQIDEEIVVSMQKLPWEGFTFSLVNKDFFANPICRLQVKSYEDLVLRIELSDGETVFEVSSTQNVNIEGSDEYQEVVFDFSGAMAGVCVASQPYLIFYVNPGQNYNGEMMIKNIEFSEPEIETPTFNSEIDPELLVYPNPATEKITIELPFNFGGKVFIFDISGRKVYESTIDDSLGNITRVDISSLRAGTYLVSLIGPNHTLSSRFQVN